eukprot:183773_1
MEKDQIENDYQHIIYHHIKNENNSIKENAFRYFQSIIDCKEKECCSLSRNEERTGSLRRGACKIYHDEEKNNANKHNGIYFFQKNEKYIQSELDMIHAYFVHHEWHNDTRYEPSTDNMNAEKYVTNIPDSTSIDQYGFGVDHDYQHLKSKYKCLRDEIIQKLDINIFEDLLIKAIKKRNINKYLKCSHYDPGYKIIRNQQILIRHILAICLYTDCSKLCTLF